MFFLKDEDDNIVSHKYYFINALKNDYFAGCNIKCEVKFPLDYNYYNIIKGDIEMADSKIKWGVMRLTRDKEGKIIPEAEVMVVPYIYDRISVNNLQTATV